MIPAQLDAADDVLPEIILRGGSQGQNPVGVGINKSAAIGIKETEVFLIAPIPQVSLPSEMNAEFFSCLITGVTGHRPGFSVEMMHVEYVQ